MKKLLKKIPEFKNGNEELNFWSHSDTSEYFDLSSPQSIVLPNLKPSTEKISLRLPANLLFRIKNFANQSDVPYQSYMKLILSEKINEMSHGSKVTNTVPRINRKIKRSKHSLKPTSTPLPKITQ